MTADGLSRHVAGIVVERSLLFFAWLPLVRILVVAHVKLLRFLGAPRTGSVRIGGRIRNQRSPRAHTSFQFETNTIKQGDRFLASPTARAKAAVSGGLSAGRFPYHCDPDTTRRKSNRTPSRERRFEPRSSPFRLPTWYTRGQIADIRGMWSRRHLSTEFLPTW